MHHIINECATSLKEEGDKKKCVDFLNGGPKKRFWKKGSKVKKYVNRETKIAFKPFFYILVFKKFLYT